MGNKFSFIAYYDGEYADYSLRTVTVPVDAILAVIQQKGDVWTMEDGKSKLGVNDVTIVRVAMVGTMSDIATPRSAKDILTELETLGWP